MPFFRMVNSTFVMKELLNKYENREPEIVFNWKDPETDAEGWTVINSHLGVVLQVAVPGCEKDWI